MSDAKSGEVRWGIRATGGRRTNPMTAECNDPAPDFTLAGRSPDGTTSDFSLADFRGKKVVLAFYPGDFTPVCTKQLCSYRDQFAEFEGVDATVLAISPQGVESHDKFASRFNFPFPLLADPDQTVGKAYGITGPLGYKRAVFVIDEHGVLRWKHVAALVGVTYKGARTLVDVVSSL